MFYLIVFVCWVSCTISSAQVSNGGIPQKSQYYSFFSNSGYNNNENISINGGTSSSSTSGITTKIPGSSGVFNQGINSKIISFQKNGRSITSTNQDGGEKYNYGSNQVPYHYEKLETTSLNSPVLSPFALQYFQAVTSAGLYPKLYDVSFAPENVSETFQNEMIYLGVELGVYDGILSISKQVGEYADQAFKTNISNFKFFKVYSNALQLALEHQGLLTEGNYQVLIKIFVQCLEDSTKSVNVYNAESALHAKIAAAANFFKSIGKSSRDDVVFTITILGRQLALVTSS